MAQLIELVDGGNSLSWQDAAVMPEDVKGGNQLGFHA